MTPRDRYERDFPEGDALHGCVPALAAAHEMLLECFADGGTLLLAGNGGSHADALHIAGELLKRFEIPRPLSPEKIAALEGRPLADVLENHLEGGLPAVVLGANGALATAVLNDGADPRLLFAQEAYALARPADVVLGISTSGEAENVLAALSASASKGASTLALTGTPGGPLAEAADVAIRAPGDSTARIQEAHQRLYHALCAGVEAAVFGD